MELSIAAMELEILVDFLEEALEHLEGIEEKILQLETSQDLELVNSIFRPAHTIKGTASFLGLNDVKYLSHELETLLDDLRNDKITVSSDLIDTLLDGVDTLAKMLQEVQTAIDLSDQNTDPVLLTISDIDYDEEINAIAELKNTSAQKKSNSVKQDDTPEEAALLEPSELLTSDELKAISYPMDMDTAFIQESGEHLDNLEQCLLELEDHPQNFELYNDIFRDLHSLKGGAGVLVSTVEPAEHRIKHPIKIFQDLAHAAEGLVQGARDTKTELTPDTLETLLTVIDRLKSILNGFVNHDTSNAQVNDLIAACREKTSSKGAASCKGIGQKTEPVEKENSEAKNFALTNTLTQSFSAIEAGFDEITIDKNRNEALGKISRSLNMIIKVCQKINLANLAENTESILNTIGSLNQGKDDNEDKLISSMTDEYRVLKQSLLDHLAVQNRHTPPPAPSPADKQPVKDKLPDKKALKSSPASASSMTMIKVPQERLDLLMNLVGELIVSKSSFPAIAKEISVDHNLTELGKKVKSAGDQVSRITDELQNIVMNMRMLPVGTVFSKFKRLVRDLGKKLDKKIVLKLSGEETELDKTIIETLGDPMVHLIRNSADHALEGPKERKKVGKPQEGTIHLKAYNQGQNVIIDIIDDGRGIDPDYIRAKAIEKGYLSLEELEKLDNQAVQNLIFKPGFSGARKVTEVSGRGVGMDVVKTNIEKIGGVVSLRSQVGIGTTITITLPLTLAISKGLEVKAAGLHYYLPLDYIIETVKLAPDMIRHHKNMQMAVIRDTLLPVFSLSTLLANSKKNCDPATPGTSVTLNSGNTDEEISMVVLNMNGKKAALCVDHFYTESEYVIKPLSGALAAIPGLTGATITSSGQVILILDPLKLF